MATCSYCRSTGLSSGDEWKGQSDDLTAGALWAAQHVGPLFPDPVDRELAIAAAGAEMDVRYKRIKEITDQPIVLVMHGTTYQIDVDVTHNLTAHDMPSDPVTCPRCKGVGFVSRWDTED